jgi:hypothetical protein
MKIKNGNVFSFSEFAHIPSTKEGARAQGTNIKSIICYPFSLICDSGENPKKRLVPDRGASCGPWRPSDHGRVN